MSQLHGSVPIMFVTLADPDSAMWTVARIRTPYVCNSRGPKSAMCSSTKDPYLCASSNMTFPDPERMNPLITTVKLRYDRIKFGKFHKYEIYFMISKFYPSN